MKSLHEPIGPALGGQAGPSIPSIVERAVRDSRQRLVARVLDEAFAALQRVDLSRLAYAEAEGGYRRAVLHRDADLEVTVIHWPAGTGSPLHGHGQSRGALRAFRGVLVEDAFTPEGEDYRYRRTVLGPGGTSILDRGACHRLRACGDAYTLHVYDPPPDLAAEQIAPELWPRLRRARRAAGRVRSGIAAGLAASGRARAAKARRPRS
jgi:hypothetical protein